MSAEELRELSREYDLLLSQQAFNPSGLDYSLMNYHRILLDKLDVVQHSAITVYDMHQRRHIYISKNFESFFGWDVETAYQEGDDYFNSRVHPDDLLMMTRAGIHWMRFVFNLNTKHRQDYKLITEYRVRDAKGDWKRVIEQFTALELDPAGNIWLALCLLDFSPDHDITAPFRCRMFNKKSGALFLFPPGENLDILREGMLSGREKEVLQLISEGLISKQIADKLYISVHTVNTHRQRIIEKLGVSNSAEAVQYAGRYGFFD